MPIQPLSINRCPPLKRFNEAAHAKIKDAGPNVAEDFTAPELRSIGVQTIIVDSDKPDEASISPGHFPFCGYELKRRDGKWLVRSITVFPKNVPMMLAAHAKLKPALDALTKRVNDGEFKSKQDLQKAARGEIGPILAEYDAATNKAPRGGK